MIQEVNAGTQRLYQCNECGFLYEERAWAERCEAWCSEHQSCNLEIIQHGRPPTNDPPESV